MAVTESKLIAGLGNPGGGYDQTRHNMGFMVADAIAQSAGVELTKYRFNAALVKTRVAGAPIYLSKPLSFMNKSGFPVQKIAAYYKIQIDDIIVVHDDMDLAFGKLKIVWNRGHGGHNGVRSIIDTLGSRKFSRVRIGVGHPEGPKSVTGHVLGRFSKQEQALLGEVIEAGRTACLEIISHGVTQAMNRINSRN